MLRSCFVHASYQLKQNPQASQGIPRHPPFFSLRLGSLDSPHATSPTSPCTRSAFEDRMLGHEAGKPLAEERSCKSFAACHVRIDAICMTILHTYATLCYLLYGIDSRARCRAVLPGLQRTPAHGLHRPHTSTTLESCGGLL